MPEESGTTQQSQEQKPPPQGGTTPPPPDWKAGVPSKHLRDTPEATLAELAKAHTSLESKLGQRVQQTGVSTAELPDDAGIEKVLEAAGLKAEETTKAFLETGSLKDEHYAALRKANPFLTKAVVNQVLKAQSAEMQLTEVAREQFKTEASQIAGGQAQLASLLAFRATLPEEQRADIDRRLESPKLYKGAIRELMAEQAAGNGTTRTGTVVNGQTTVASTSGFTSLKDMSAAISRIETGAATAEDKIRLAKTDMQKLQRSG